MFDRIESVGRSLRHVDWTSKIAEERARFADQDEQMERNRKPDIGSQERHQGKIRGRLTQVRGTGSLRSESLTVLNIPGSLADR